MCCVPSLPSAGVKLTEQLATPVVPVAASEQLVGEKVPPLLTSVAHVSTVPVGVVFVPPLVSLTVAVHDVDTLTATDDGVHATDVDVERFVTINANALALLVA